MVVLRGKVEVGGEVVAHQAAQHRVTFVNMQEAAGIELGRTQAGQLIGRQIEGETLLGEPGVDGLHGGGQRTGLDPPTVGHGRFAMLERVRRGGDLNGRPFFNVRPRGRAARISGVTGVGGAGFGVGRVGLALRAGDSFEHFATAGLVTGNILSAGSEHHEGHRHA
ncbi:MAG: hypothetical protein GC162_10740 [Planctomycetes bacterium]|nr:hypothetical protein [Planctomycetota bacterium]